MNHFGPPSGPANALRSPVYADNMRENGMLNAKVAQVMQASGGYYDNLPDDIQRMVHMYMDWQRVTPHTHFHELWNSYVADHENPNVRAFFDGLAAWRKKDLLQMALQWGHPPGAESMPQANPYTITNQPLKKGAKFG